MTSTVPPGSNSHRPHPHRPHTRRATRAFEPTQILRGSVADARELLGSVERVAVLTGAGISTDSGVPDYRGPASQRATPMVFDEFVREVRNRRRYWARSYQGWAQMGQASPNQGHSSLSRWEKAGRPNHLVGVITQNVDGLHEAAGTTRLVTLHGRIADVVCLDCHDISARAELQQRLAELNPHVDLQPFLGHAELRPDGDAVVDEWQTFRLAPCRRCGGVLKPDVVFFGEPVPAARVEAAYAMVDAADALLVAGSSLTVMSGLRFARHAAKTGKPLVIVNHGATRADDLASIRLDANTSYALSELVG